MREEGRERKNSAFRLLSLFTLLSSLFVVILAAGVCETWGQGGPAAASTSPAQGSSMVVDESSNGKTVVAKSVAKVTIRMEGNPTTGYSWTVTKVDGDAVKADGDVKYVAKPVAQGIVGSGGHFDATFTAVREGKATVTLAYARPWEKNKAPARTFTVTIDVQSPLAPQAASAPASGPTSRAALTPIRHTPPRVLVFGDSICVYYFPFVKDLLKDKAVVVHGGHTVGTRFVKENLDKILATGGGQWDVIHFNCGLHDVKDHLVVPIDEYEKNLREIVTRLKAANARLVWGTTTPVGGHRDGNAGDRQDKDVVEYNAVAKKIMEENGIPIDDLYGVAKPKIADLQKKDEVHFEDEGSKVLAQSVADAILAAIGAKGPTTTPK